MNKDGNSFRPSLCDDIQAILSLYEASYYGLDGETTMEEAWEFTAKHLKVFCEDVDMNAHDAMKVRHALELPLHWRMPRLEARWFIDVYQRSEGVDKRLLKLAKLDFNIVQAVHLEELKDMSRYSSHFSHLKKRTNSTLKRHKLN